MNIQPIIATEAGQIAHYAAIRARLMGPKARPANINVLPVPEPEPLPEQKQFRLVQVPTWKVIPTQFNQHVVDYRRWLLAKEKQGSDFDDFAPAPFKPSMTEITAEVLQSFPGISLEELKGDRRHRSIVAARQVAMYQIRYRRPDLSYPAIGRFFGGRDHSTVHHAVHKIERLMEAAE
jgi:hypothetical protein